MTEEKLEKNEGLKVYEVGYLLLPSIEDTKTQEEAQKIRDIIEKNEGQFLSEGNPEMKILSYPIENQSQAYFGWIKFESNVDSISVIKGELDKNQNIIRFILIKTVKENTIIPTKSGKFSFDKTKDTEDISNTDKKEEVKEEKIIDEKELDETIDELVID